MRAELTANWAGVALHAQSAQLVDSIEKSRVQRETDGGNGTRTARECIVPPRVFGGPAGVARGFAR